MERLHLSVAPLQNSSDSTVTLSTQTTTISSQLSSPVTLGGEGGNHFAGCIDRVIVNGEMLPLLTPEDSTDEPQACGPR